jgi:CRISPR-associated protein Csm5
VKYRLTCLTPTLVGSGDELSPIDYMVWKDQVNILNQTKIFQLLARGPRLEGYLTQIKRAEKLDFASWGGFAQSYAERRIPFEHPAATKNWESHRAEQLFSPTFAARQRQAYVPASALRGALRTALLASRMKPEALQSLGERTNARVLEKQFLGSGAADALRGLAISDSAPAAGDTAVYQVRAATIESRGPGQMAPGWKHIPRGVNFAEMATPRTRFEGTWTETVNRPQRGVSLKTLLQSANLFSTAVLASHLLYARACRLTRLEESLSQLDTRLKSFDASSCLLPLGWGTGYLAKTAWPHPEDPALRKALGELPYYSRAIRSGLPFPKTRRVVMLAGQPTTLPGWVELEVG